jgi:hypothetical protein
VPEIAVAGANAGADFILMADHNSVEAKTAGDERWHCEGKVLVAIGSEVTVSEGHLLVFDVPVTYFPAPSDAKQAMQSMQKMGGYGFIALPCDLKGHWHNFDVREPGVGIEVFNLSALARTKINIPSFLAALYRYKGASPIAAFSYITARPDTELRVWDKMLMQAAQKGEPLPNMIASLDAHAVMRIAGREFFLPTYEEAFRTLRTHALTTEPLSGKNENVDKDLALLHEALRLGRSYASYDNYGDPKGFVVEFRHAGRYIGSTGDTISANLCDPKSYVLAVRTPQTRTIIRIYHNGKKVIAKRGGYLDFPVNKPGLYRVEVSIYRSRIGNLCLGTRPWIFSNAIYVKHVSANETVGAEQHERLALGQDGSSLSS